MAVQLTTLNEILGKMIRKMIADTAVNDINRGSVLLDLLEAAAIQDFENNAAILSVLETLSIDALKNTDLDNRAADYGLTRTTSAKSTGFIKITDTSITKKSTTLYAVKPAPIAGNSIIYVNNADGWGEDDGSGNLKGKLYIGRGTRQFEGPIEYTNIENFGSYFKITLSSSLKKDHLISDSVVDAQGKTDRLISTGTSVKVPSNYQTPEILYSTIRDAILPAGESEISDIPIVSLSAGSSNNARINTIVSFSAPPFTGAAVTNTNALTDGRDVESDDDLRERIKTHATTLARGTRQAILSSIIGVSDESDAKQVYSATITEPSQVGDPSIVYIDDGSGFQPSYKGQTVDVLLSYAMGDEEFLQLANFPLPRPQVINEIDGPYELFNGASLSVSVDEEEEEIFFYSSDFKNIAAATAPEIAAAINSKAVNFRCRLAENSARLLLYTVTHDAEYIQVSAKKSENDATVYANNAIKFPTNAYSYITLYKNNMLLNEKETSATVRSNLFSQWGMDESGGNIIIEVDGTPSQDRFFSQFDFGLEIGDNLSSVSLSQWVDAFNSKFAGITALETSSGRMLIKSNKIGSSSSVKIVGGDYLSKMFDQLQLESNGRNSDFALNRQTGNIQIKTAISKGDTISAGIADARGSILSTATSSGSYDLSYDAGRPPEMIIAVDDGSVTPRSSISVSIGNTIEIEFADPIMRIIGNTASMFAAAQVEDYVYIAKRSTGVDWPSDSSCGLFKILRKGGHTSAGTDTYIEVENINGTAGGPYVIQSTDDIQIFGAKSYPQIWNSSLITATGGATLKNIVDSINSTILNTKSSIFKNSSIKLTSTTEANGAIAVPVSVGKLSNVIASRQGSVVGSQPHTANKITNKDLFSVFKRTNPVSTFLDRYTYTDIRETILTNTSPNTSTDCSEVLDMSASSVLYDDVLNVTSGNNKSHFRSIKEFDGEDAICTQIESPKTIFDYIEGDEVQAVRPLSISSEDSLVLIADTDITNNTVNVNMWRTGRVNGNYAATNTSFSANDADSEAGVTFGTGAVWSKVNMNTEFKDYAVWMRSRNWYKSSGGATMILRAKEYGPNGDKHKFKIEYPTLPGQDAAIGHENSPTGTITTMVLGSGEKKTISVADGAKFRVESLGSGYQRYIFQQEQIQLDDVTIGDILSIAKSSGVTDENSGTFSIVDLDNVTSSEDTEKYIDIYNPAGVETSVGLPEITRITTVGDIIGTSTVQTIVCISQGNIGDIKYFTLYDEDGVVVFWYRIDDSGTMNSTPPTITGANRYVQIPNAQTTDSDYDVASKVTAAINSDIKFSATFSGNIVTATLSRHMSVNQGYTLESIGFDHGISDLSIQSNGKILAMGSFTSLNGNTRNSLIRLNSDGTLENYFYKNLISDGAGTGFNGSVSAIALQPDGKILVGGLFTSLNGNTRNSLIRLNSDGTEDTSFYTNLGTGFNGSVSVITLQPDGRILVGGFFTSLNGNTRNRLVRLNPSGVEDTSFYTNLGAGFSNGVTSITVQPQEATQPPEIKILVGGEFISLNGNTRNRLVRLNSSGGEDTSFYTNLGTGFNASVRSITIQSSIENYGILIGGGFTSLNGNIRNRLVRLNSSGTEDITFYNSLGTGFSNVVQSIALQPDGRILVGGFFTSLNGNTRNRLVRLNSSGTEDITFYNSLGTGFGNDVQSIIVQTDGKILAGGSFTSLNGNTRNKLVRLNSSGGEDITFYNSLGNNFIVNRTINGAPDVTLGGKYIKMYDKDGSVGVWFNVYGDSIPTTGANRNIEVELTPGDSAQIIALKLKATIDLDAQFVATVGTGADNNKVTVTDKYNGSRTEVNNNTGLLTVERVQTGINDEMETISRASGFNIFPLESNDMKTICDTISSSSTLTAVPVGDDTLTVIKSTKEEIYGYLAHGHVNEAYVSLFDGESFVKTFDNSNPNFILKKPLTLQYLNQGPGNTTIYSMENCPNPDSSETGEFFKLIPRTTKNVKHHLSHRALSQLPILADIDIVKNFRRIQLRSKKLGSAGAIEIVGGRANSAEFSLIGDSIINGSNLELKTSAYPFTIGSGDAVRIYNTSQAKRKSRLSILDTIDVKESTTGKFDFLFNPKITGFSSSTTWTIQDVSGQPEYNRESNIVWRWAISSGSGDLSKINPGDVLNAYDLISWSLVNQTQSEHTGVSKICGFPIVKVSNINGNKYLDVINPSGVAMDATPMGTGKIEICPTPAVPIRVKHLENDTRYRIEKLGFNDLVRIRWVYGEQPYFVDCGVAVDDFITISGTTFNSYNNGRFRILAVDNTSMIIKNANATEELHTLKTIPSITWTSGSSTISCSSSSAVEFYPGSWIKKKEDTDDKFVQILNVSTSGLIAIVTLGSSYRGASSLSDGVSFNQTADVDGGVILKSMSDIEIYESDSVVSNSDYLIIDNISSTGSSSSEWFNASNSGVRRIIAFGTNELDKRPFLRVENTGGISEINRKMSVRLDGLYVLEGEDSKYETIRGVEYSAIDQSNSNYRTIYISPIDKSYKISQTHGTKIESLGKIGFDVGLTTGIDGYNYYIGLMRTVQRVIDGFEPDSSKYPGRRAIGSRIEVLPPIIIQVSVNLDVTTKDGVNLNDVINDIKSVIINYVNGLGVGKDVILSEIISRAMSIYGVEAVTFTTPKPSEERILIANDQKALINPDLISIA